MSTTSSFKNIGNKHNGYKGKDWMKRFRESLTEHTMTINSKKKNVKLLTSKE